jgi:signal transduction histidine kinase
MIFSCGELDTIVKDLGQILEIRENLSQTITEVNLEKELSITLNGLENDILQSEAVIDINFEKVDTVHTIRPYLQSILLNLLSNAIKYRHPDRPLHIKISSAIVDNKIEIDFRDNGLGIDLLQYGKKLFKLYSRFHFHVEGKGKGLFLVKTHVDAMGGKLEVQSEVNEGTVFKIFLKNN